RRPARGLTDPPDIHPRRGGLIRFLPLMDNPTRVEKESFVIIPTGQGSGVPRGCRIPAPLAILPRVPVMGTPGREPEGLSRGYSSPRAMAAAHSPGRIDAPAATPAKRDADPWAMIDVYPLPSFICGPDGLLLRYNKRAVELWGVAPDLSTGHRFGGAHRLFAAAGRIIPTQDRPVARVLRTSRGIRDLELIIERRDGSRVMVLANIEPLFDEAGAVIGAVNCMQDITIARRVEDAWRESL